MKKTINILISIIVAVSFSSTLLAEGQSKGSGGQSKGSEGQSKGSGGKSKRSGGKSKEFQVREVSTVDSMGETDLERALNALQAEEELETEGEVVEGQEAIEYSVPTINFKNGPSNRFLDDSTFRSEDHFALEATGTINVTKNNLLMTINVGSDDGFKLTIEGGTFISSVETTTPAIGNSTTTIEGNMMSYDGGRLYAESYGVFQFEKAGKYPVRLVFFEITGEENLEFSAAPGDLLGDLEGMDLLDNLAEAPFELVNSDSKSALKLK